MVADAPRSRRSRSATVASGLEARISPGTGRVRSVPASPASSDRSTVGAVVRRASRTSRRARSSATFAIAISGCRDTLAMTRIESSTPGGRSGNPGCTMTSVESAGRPRSAMRSISALRASNRVFSSAAAAVFRSSAIRTESVVVRTPARTAPRMRSARRSIQLTASRCAASTSRRRSSVVARSATWSPTSRACTAARSRAEARSSALRARARARSPPSASPQSSTIFASYSPRLVMAGS